MRKLDPDSLHIPAYTDASFATNHVNSSQLGYIIPLCDKANNACVLDYASYKSHLLARSVLGAETYAFADAYNFRYYAKHDLQNFLRRRVSLSMFTDSKSLFDVITKCPQTQDYLLMIDLKALTLLMDCLW